MSEQLYIAKRLDVGLVIGPKQFCERLNIAVQSQADFANRILAGVQKGRPAKIVGQLQKNILKQFNPGSV